MATQKEDSMLELVVVGCVFFSNYRNLKLDLEYVTA